MAVRRYLTVALVLLATAAIVTGVHGTRPKLVAQTSVAAPTGSDADYARMMIAHHAQAVRMSKDLLSRPGVPERIRDIAGFIVADQDREIDQLTAWLAAWDLGTTGGHEHDMLGAADLTRLDRASDADAVPLYLRLMIEHHRGAIVMSRELLDGGDQRNVFIHSVAKHVINEQTAENDAMAPLLG